MRDVAGGDGARHFQHTFEVIHTERDAHAEHDDGEAPGNPFVAEPRKQRRMNQRYDSSQHNPDREKVREQMEQAGHGG